MVSHPASDATLRPVDILRVVVVDDHRAFADALSVRLDAEPDLAVVGRAVSASDADSAVQALDPDVVILDVDLGEDDGIELATRLIAAYPSLRVVIATCHDDAQTAARALRAWVAAFLPKECSIPELLRAIRGAVHDETHVPPHVLTGALRELSVPAEGVSWEAEIVGRLTKREREVLGCMVEGLDRAGIGERLFLSTNTVRTHARNILAKLQVHSTLEAVALALRAGITPPQTDGRAGERHPAQANDVGRFTL